jgi:DDB1- and CUL4-associated factor 5
MIVQGHLSIVNTTLIHPVLPLIATAGIERQVVLHSPTPNTPWGTNIPLTPTTTRSLPSEGLSMTDPSSLVRLLIRMNTLMEPDESLGEDARSIAYFDMYVSFLVFL